MNLVIVKYNAGNTQSLLYALERLGVEARVSDIPEELQAADKVIFPGVGEASTAMRYLQEKGLDLVLKDLKQAFLGICLGMQLMGRHSEENDTPCLDIFSEKILRFPDRDDPAYKIPHMGWNTLNQVEGPLFKGVGPGAYAYFVHSYFVASGPDTIATCHYPEAFSAAVHKNNFYAVQFHPEKSGKTGQRILSNFLDL